MKNYDIQRLRFFFVTPTVNQPHSKVFNSVIIHVTHCVVREKFRFQFSESEEVIVAIANSIGTNMEMGMLFQIPNQRQLMSGQDERRKVDSQRAI